MLSNTCKYALRALIYLGKFSQEDKKIGIKVISEKLGISSPFFGKNTSEPGKTKIIGFNKRAQWRFWLG